MKRILGLDLGTNSIGTAVVEFKEDAKSEVVHSGSRIIPMDAATMGDFGKGNTVSQTAEKTGFRSVRILRQRYLLRRERLHRVLSILGFLPDHFVQKLDQYGKFIDESEPKLAWNDKQFLFTESFDEMLSDFRKNQPSIFLNPDAKVPHDWTMYYLRKKALTAKISEQELAWILISFNQKRGYYQLRGEEVEGKEGEVKEYHVLKVVSVEATDQKRGNDVWYNVHLENGWIYRRSSSMLLDWVGKMKEFIVTSYFDEHGNPKLDKEGNVKRSFSSPGADDWTLLKTKTEKDVKNSGKTVGQYIYDAILQKPDQKIIGKLVRVVERNFYKDELIKILQKQKEFHPKLNDEKLYLQAVEDLYRSNEDYRRTIQGKDFTYLIAQDVILYQRPLKTKKSQIADCKYEAYRKGEEIFKLKAISKSHPLYQEFRLWKFVSQLKMFYKDVDVTSQFLKNDDDYVAVFEWLNQIKEVDNAQFVKFKNFNIPKAELQYYRWNYVTEKGKSYPCNETFATINNRLKKHKLEPIKEEFLVDLWHILYSVKDHEQVKKALARFARKNGYEPQKFVDALRACIFENEYGTYSEKAVKKLLALMRRGKYWSAEAIDARIKQRIDNIINGVFDEGINDRTRQKCAALNNFDDFCGMDEWLASYVVYGRHAESADAFKWESVGDIDKFLEEFKQHSMRNPIVEQVVMETMRVVRDLWKKYGKFDEIHVELGREMKQTKTERERDSKNIVANENANFRIRKLLEEFQSFGDVESVRAFSPSHQTIFKIYEDFAISQGAMTDDIAAIYGKFNERDAKKQPTTSEIGRYKLWLEQQYRSPYTGEVIPLGKLFTTAYEIEHIIPQSLFTLNTLANKVICEEEVNKLKGNMLGMEFIKSHAGQKVTLSGGKIVTIFDEDQYKNHIEKHYANNNKKASNLKAEELPQAFTSRQMNDSRYIARFISGLLSNVVRVEGELEPISKNLIMTNGSITDTLKKEWGVNDIWNDMVAPRFARMNEITGTNNFGAFVCEDGKKFFRTAIPLEFSKGFTKKRIDHRHHAMDAVVIACTTRNHINYLNNVASKENDDHKERVDTRHKLKNTLCFKHKYNDKGEYQWRFHKPWDTFTQDMRESLEQLIVSFKQNLRVINKATNKFTKFEDGKKETVIQKGQNWAIRKSMHADTVYGSVNLRMSKVVQITEAIKNVNAIVDKELKNQIKTLVNDGLDPKKIVKQLKDNEVTKAEIYYFTNETNAPLCAVRKSIDDTFDAKKIDAITDSGIKKIMLAHLEQCNNDSTTAFSPDGIEKMNLNIVALNGGKQHKPILKVRLSEALGNKFAVGQTGNKSDKYVVAAKGTNLFFAIYHDATTGKHDYESVPLNVVIERQKNGLASVADVNGNGLELKYVLSPNDLIYLPTEEQVGRPISNQEIDKKQIYKVVSFSEKRLYVIPHTIASVIIDKMEFTSNNKVELLSQKAEMRPIIIDRLGNVIKMV